MEEIRNEQSTEQEAASGPSEKKSRKRRLFSYRWILHNVPYFLFLAVLAILYIYNGHYADKTVRSISKISRELKDKQYEFKILKGEVIFRSKQSELARAVTPMGLRELTNPPSVLNDSLITVNPN